MRFVSRVLLGIGTVCLLIAPPAIADPALVRNINQTDAGSSSDPRFHAALHGAVMVVDGGPALDLWRSDGTPGGTELLVRGLFETTDTVSLLAAVADSGTVFLGHRGSQGLWRSDASSVGTARLLADQRVDVMALLPAANRLVLISTADERIFSLRALDLLSGTVETLTTFEPLDGGRIFRASFAEVAGRIVAVVPLPEAFNRDALWATDGTVDGTRRLGIGDIDIATRVSEGSLGVFLERTEASVLTRGGLDAWVTDGTESGTARIGTVFDGNESASAPTTLRAVGGRVLFLTLVAERRELWAVDPSDDTIERLTIADPTNDAFFYVANSLRSFGSLASFAAHSDAEGLEPWITDGTLAGTRLLADLCPGPCSSVPTLGRPGGFASLGDSLLFAASDGAAVGVWQVGATSGASGSVLSRFADACDGCTNPRDISLVPFDTGRLVIGNRDGFGISDGTPAGTRSLSAARVASTRAEAVRVGGRLLLTAFDNRGLEPWTSDGTASGTELLGDLLRDDAGSAPDDPLAFDGEVIFAARDLQGDGSWRTDGTTDGTLRLGTTDAEDPWASVHERRLFRDRLLLLSTTLDGTAIWSTDDLDSPPERLTPFSVPPPILPPQPVRLTLGDVGETAGGLVFCQDATLRVTDGTAAGTAALTAAPWTLCDSFVSLGDVAILRAFGVGESVGRLWRTDGSLAGTREVTVAGGGVLEGSFRDRTELDGQAVLTRQTDEGAEVWRVTAAGIATRIAGPVIEPRLRVAGTVSGRLLIRLGNQGDEALWSLRLDGTAELLVPTAIGALEVIAPVADNPASPVRFVRRLGGIMGGSPHQILRTDGTAAGTERVLSDATTFGIVAQLDDRLLRSTGGVLEALGEPGSEPVALARELSVLRLPDARLVDGVLVFSGTDAEGRSNLWRTDGEPAGTFPLTDFELDPLPARPEVLLPVGERVLFSATRRDQGEELWALDRADLDARVLALRDEERFQIRVRWFKPDGESGRGVPQRLTTDTGLFYFFRESNVELMIKVLDGRNSNGHFWVFYGALSNLAYEIEVTDTGTGAQKTYTNPAGHFGSVGDTRAFAVPGPSAAPVPDSAQVVSMLDGLAALAPGERSWEGEAPREKMSGGCAGSVQELCLQQTRFEVRVDWRKPDGEMGQGVARPLTADTGYFYFFRESNVELVVKVLDGRNANGHFWVFYGALSNVAYTITVTDTATGAVKVYDNPQGTFASVGDTRAFPLP